MIYTFNSKEITFKKVKTIQYLVFFLICFSIFSSLGFTTAIKINTFIEKIPVILRINEEEFSEKSLRREIKKLNLKFENIIIQQFKVETNYGRSYLFKEQNNLFGLKYPRLRPTTALGEQNNHCFYKNWRDCLIDYALWQVQNAAKIETEAEYYQLLDAIYSEVGEKYSVALKSVK